MRTAEMLKTHPVQSSLEVGLVARTVDALAECAQTCTACADACLSEQMVAELRECIGLNLNCADICGTTARILSRRNGYDAKLVRAQLEVCVQACKSCGDECDSHADHHEHCRVCAEACRACEQACNGLLAVIV